MAIYDFVFYVQRSFATPEVIVAQVVNFCKDFFGNFS